MYLFSLSVWSLTLLNPSLISQTGLLCPDQRWSACLSYSVLFLWHENHKKQYVNRCDGAWSNGKRLKFELHVTFTGGDILFRVFPTVYKGPIHCCHTGHSKANVYLSHGWLPSLGPKCWAQLLFLKKIPPRSGQCCTPRRYSMNATTPGCLLGMCWRSIRIQKEHAPGDLEDLPGVPDHYLLPVTPRQSLISNWALVPSSSVFAKDKPGCPFKATFICAYKPGTLYLLLKP